MHAALMLNMTLLGIVDVIFDAQAFTAWLLVSYKGFYYYYKLFFEKNIYFTQRNKSR